MSRPASVRQCSSRWRRKVLVITGSPGVGKATLVNAILKILSVKASPWLRPTGRAAKRLSESAGFEAKTIHQLLEVDPMHGGLRRRYDHTLDRDLIIQTSMPLMYVLVTAVPDYAAMILVGDVDQLPSVGPGQVLANIIDSDAAPVVRLTQMFRQAAEGRIIRPHSAGCQVLSGSYWVIAAALFPVLEPRSFSRTWPWWPHSKVMMPERP
jgi:exodeoxyribonuclease V alpha subunit